MYSPKIHESLIPILYKLAKAEGRPMTKLVNELVRSALHARGIMHADGSIDQTSTRNTGGSAQPNT